jgi:uncharacterized protein involved in exopolysaccharide biosynthesis
VTIDTSRGAIEAALYDMRSNEFDPEADILDAVTRERDVALAQARYIAKALEAAANQRDEALAREAVLREALESVRSVVYGPAALTLADHKHQGGLLHKMDAALTNTATAAEARDAALVGWPITTTNQEKTHD